jgi:hypothetical protein
VTAHLTPEQFVDLAEGTQPESAVRHLAACETCRQELADLRAMMAAAEPDEVPEPSPLFWNHLSSRVRGAVEQEPHPRSWREWFKHPRVFVPSLAGALAALVAVMLLPKQTLAPPIPSSPLPVAAVTVPSLPPLAPLGATDDPQLTLVAAFATPSDWDEMADEVALSAAGATDADAVVGTMTIDEQRELRRLLAEEMAQPPAPEIRS